ncbi:AAA family ATPase [Fodinibius sp.]|uniref:bifunctional aminoglycoside phosphotransferase/ATP-binding protein n=1 Tax=Fodinibius sp. TaxID=1872440 RepID=UPI002ACE4DC9|nr:AAA family ATPase [Fodinibius sp.]MDZ7658256.1 AAA family ATPase [Fodinibius sp.]
MNSSLISFLQNPEAYPHGPEAVTHIQTHISHVFLASPFVYKFKKSVDFGFLDYSTLDKREKFCHREVELNRRLSDDIYLGVVSVLKEGDSFRISDEVLQSDSVVEYAVKMKQLPEEYFLHTYLEDGTLTNTHLDRVADKLADFYNNQQPDEQVLQYGKIATIKVNTDENFEQTKAFTGQTIEDNTYRAVQYFTNQYFDRRSELFERRIAQKRIVDGHGDLHLEHIHITPDNVQIYDCIEFNDRFRYGDVAADLAFLAMDLDFNNCWPEERYFIDQMADKLDDPDLLEIIDFYKCYRAYVKGKVKSLQSGEEEVPQADREKASQTAREYFELSLRYALLGSKPIVLIFMGGVGTGKTTLAKHFEQKFNIDRFSSDRIRKSMAGVPLQERTPSEQRDKLYNRSMSEQTYQSLVEKMEECFKDGKSVILDATFSNKMAREKLVRRFRELEVNYLFVEAQAPEEVIKSRLKQRDQQDDIVSDARLEDFELLKSRYSPPTEIADENLISVQTDQAVEQTIRTLYFELADRNITGGNN